MSQFGQPAVLKRATPMKTPNPLTRSESVPLGSPNAGVAAKSPRTDFRSGILGRTTSAETTQTRTRHPKGHRVKQLAEIWETMDSSEFLHLTDTYALNDVWVQPIEVVQSKGNYVTVSVQELVLAPYIKWRTAQVRMSVFDLFQMLYLAEVLSKEMDSRDTGYTRPTMDAWLREKASICVKERGIEEGKDWGKLATFLLSSDKSGCTFAPTVLPSCFSFYFRKIYYHSYKASSDEPKVANPCMIKCRAVKGSFDYIIEARLIMLGEEKRKTVGDSACLEESIEATLELPETQPLEA